ncbi:MAG: hypothetical protein EAZ15_02880 [Sphingobacteriales bacterium]|nr:MAG: hypothetical protein EAZ15_02880 [Sphingobacteriales bacterium]
MKKIFLFLFFIICFKTNQAQYKVDTMCGVKVKLDKSGKLLSRYKPNIPGGGYITGVKLAVDFWKSCPNNPVNNLPLYITHCSMYRDGKGGYYGSTWPHNPVCVNAGMVQSLAIDWLNYSGDTTVISLTRKGLDHQIDNGTTPSNWDWANVPYASSDAGDAVYKGSSKFDAATTDEDMGRGDGSYSLEVDKIGEMGMGYLKFYEITNEKKYLLAAINCADALAKHVRIGTNIGNVLNWKTLAITSPWPFRVKAQTGEVQEAYTSHVIENLRLMDELLRIKAKINLSVAKVNEYQKTAKIVTEWLYSVEGPVKTSIWKGYFEDIRWDPINLNRVNNSPMEFARFLIKNPAIDRNINTTVPALIWWVKNTFGEPGMNAINEQTGCYQPMGSHTARYASICALWYERTGDKWFKEEAYRHFNHANYMVHPDGVVDVGHSWGGEVWFSDGYTDYIRHFMEGLAAIPEWAPAGENHLLKSSSVVTKIKYQKNQITYTTFDSTAAEVFRLAKKPVVVTVNNTIVKEGKTLTTQNYTWQPLTVGGVLKINHSSGNNIKVVF